MTRGSARLVSGARQTVLTIGAVLGLLCILVSLAALLFGVRPLVFRSGSMSPTIGTGALAISHDVPAADLRRGDVVSVPTPGGSRVTHRIHSVEHAGDAAILRLKGDANDAVDATPYRVTHADVVVFHVPWVGYAVGWLTSPVGLVLLGLYAAFLLSVLLRGRVDSGGGTGPADEPPAPGRRAAGRRRKPTSRDKTARASVTAGLVVVTMASGVLLQQRSDLTLAAWTDGPTVSGAQQTAYTVDAPDGSGCAVWTGGGTTSRGVNLTWPTAAKATSYTTAVTGITATSKSVVTVGSNQQLQLRYDPRTTANQGKVATITATPQLTATAAWKGPTTTWKIRTGSNQGTQPICGDANPAVVEIRAPDGVTRTVAAERTFISGATGCTADIAFCGTIDDASTIASVTYTLKRTSGSTVRYFNGTSWGTSTAQVTASSTTYQNQLTFYEDSTTATVYPNTTGVGTYVLTMTVTDSWANVTTTSVSFTLT